MLHAARQRRSWLIFGYKYTRRTTEMEPYFFRGYGDELRHDGGAYVRPMANSNSGRTRFACNFARFEFLLAAVNHCLGNTDNLLRKGAEAVGFFVGGLFSFHKMGLIAVVVITSNGQFINGAVPVLVTKMDPTRVFEGINVGDGSNIINRGFTTVCSLKKHTERRPVGSWSQGQCDHGLCAGTYSGHTSRLGGFYFVRHTIRPRYVVANEASPVVGSSYFIRRGLTAISEHDLKA